MKKDYNYCFIFLSIFFQSMAVILNKTASLYMKTFDFFSIIKNPIFFGVLICLGFQAIFWQMVLRKYELFFAYIFSSLIYIIILVISYFIFKEHIYMRNILGSIVIMVGVIIFNYNKREIK